MRACPLPEATAIIISAGEQKAINLGEIHGHIREAIEFFEKELQALRNAEKELPYLDSYLASDVEEIIFEEKIFPYEMPPKKWLRKYVTTKLQNWK